MWFQVGIVEVEEEIEPRPFWECFPVGQGMKLARTISQTFTPPPEYKTKFFEIKVGEGTIELPQVRLIQLFCILSVDWHTHDQISAWFTHAVPPFVTFFESV